VRLIIFAFHPRAQKCSAAAAKLMHDAAVEAGAPVNCTQWVSQPSIEATDALMRHPDVALVIATGGGAMVKAAYSSGHPALGVGPGGVPVYIEKTANLKMAVEDVIASKTFDNGTICSSDQSVIFDDRLVAEKALKMFEASGAYLCTDAEKASWKVSCLTRSVAPRRPLHVHRRQERAYHRRAGWLRNSGRHQEKTK
jgi:acyl-CoA reductase-like NAD-dependent aldehyde dehydrogenase